MGRRGISSVVSVALITLGAIVGVGLLWTFVNKNIDNAKNEVTDPDCLTINLEIIKCEAFNYCNYNFGNMGYDANVLIKRDVGPGDITGLRFIFESPQGFKGTYDVELDGLNLDELQSLQFEPYNAIPVQAGDPKLLTVAALIGDKKDVCPTTSNTVKCPVVNNPIPFGNEANNTNPGSIVSSNRVGNCCQFPQNYSQCYNGGDPAYVFNSATGQYLSNEFPGQNITACCQNPPF